MESHSTMVEEGKMDERTTGPPFLQRFIDDDRRISEQRPCMYLSHAPLSVSERVWGIESETTVRIRSSIDESASESPQNISYRIISEETHEY